MSLSEGVIVLDDSDSEDGEQRNTVTSVTTIPALAIPRLANVDINGNTSTLLTREKTTHNDFQMTGPEIIEIDITDHDSDEDVENSRVSNHNLQVEVIEGGESLDFQEMIEVLEKDTEVPDVVINNKRGPVCWNSSCDNPAFIIAEPAIRKYYNIPPKTSCKLCYSCVDSFFKFIIRSLETLETVGNMLERQCTDSKVVAVSDNQLDHSDPELEKLLGNAIREIVVEIDEKYDIRGIFRRTKDQLINQLENSVIEGEKLSQNITKIETELYESIEAFKRSLAYQKVITLPELDIPVETDINIQNSGSFEDENVVLNSCESFGEPSGLPPYGEIVMPPPNVGDVVYAMKEDAYSEWIPFEITDIIYEAIEGTAEFVEKLILKNTDKNSNLRRIARSDLIAYSNVSTVRLGLGCRIIAPSDKAIDKQTKLYSGIVAELPTNFNSYRYLIFFDNGSAQYSHHHDLKVVYRPAENIHDYFVNSNFVKEYLLKFPYRMMVNYKVGRCVRVEQSGFWIIGRVDDLDCSLIRLTFLNDNHSEWIYRGSPRLEPIFKRLFPNKSETSAISVEPQLMSKAPKQPQLDEPILLDSSDDDEIDACNETSCTNQIMNQTPDRLLTKSSVVQRYPSAILVPMKYHSHRCSRFCVNWVRYAEEKTHNINPLAIPTVFAFKREVDASRSITYTAPCGKRLKNFQEVLKYLSDTYIPLKLDMFDFDVNTQIFDEYVALPRFKIIEDISFGAEWNPIACVNEVDAKCPDLMQYLTERRPLEGVNINVDPDFLVCCECTDNCRDRAKCRCWRLTVENYKPFNQGEGKRHISKIGYQYHRLHDNVVSGIYECNSRCSCNKTTCINRVVQHPTRQKLQLFKTPKKGWGTRSLNDIPEGVFISTYVGNILTEMSANETGTINGDEYFAELDHIEVMKACKANFEAEVLKMSDDDVESEESVQEISPVKNLKSSRRGKRKRSSPPESKASKAVNSEISTPENSDDLEEDSLRKYYGPNETVYVIDSKIAGNIGRFYNHSCDPNIFVQNVYVDTHDLRFPWVAFFALKHIRAGAELTWDYGYKIGSVPGKVLYCHCGSKNCRKRLL